MGFEIQEPLQPFMVRSRRYVTRSRPILRRRPDPPLSRRTPRRRCWIFNPPRDDEREAEFSPQGRKERRRSSAGKLFLGGTRASPP